MKPVRVLAAALAATTLASCGYEGSQSLPLPGAVGGDDTYTVSLVLTDATNLVPKETCRANDTVIGSVESVTLNEELRAEVVCRIKDSVTLPANVTAALRETSLLGERFIALDVPEGEEPRGELARGAVIPASATRVDPNVEMVFGALSQVLNGGGLANLETITRELNAALSGSDLGATTRALERIVSTFNENRDDITTSLVALDRLAGTLARQRRALTAALDSVPDGLAVLDRQRPRLVSTLRQLSELSRVAVPLIRRSRADTVADLKHLQPVLKDLTKAGHNLATTLDRIAPFPFPGNALHTLRGDYVGFYGRVLLDVDALNALLGGFPKTGSGPVPGAQQQPTDDPLPGLPLPLPGLVGSDGQLDLDGLLAGLLGGGK